MTCVAVVFRPLLHWRRCSGGGFTSDYNPFANLDLHIPVAFRGDVTRYTTSQNGGGDTSEDSTPFVRYVDLWALAVAIGAEENAYVSGVEQHRFILGSVPQGDLVRIEFLQLIAIAHSRTPTSSRIPVRSLRLPTPMRRADFPFSWSGSTAASKCPWECHEAHGPLLDREGPERLTIVMELTVQRERTAMSRAILSRPMSLAYEDEVID